MATTPLARTWPDPNPQADSRRADPRRWRTGEGGDSPEGRRGGARAAVLRLNVGAGARDAVGAGQGFSPRSLVLYEDADILILDKPAGLSVQGGTKTTRHIDRLLGAWGSGGERPRLVHRLDRDTSGVLALGKSANSAGFLARAFAERDVEKTYWAIVTASPRRPRADRCRARQGWRRRSGADGRRRARRHGGQAGHLELSHARAAGDASWLALRPLTGRRIS